MVGRAAVGRKASIIIIVIVAAIGLTAAIALWVVNFLPQPCGTNPGVSTVIVNGVSKCMVGPPSVTYPDGRVDFRNGTVVDLHENLTGAAMIGGGGSGGSKNDTMVLTDGTRIIFYSRGIIATTYPYQGREVFSDGTVRTFPACPYRIKADLTLGHGASGNGTVWYTSSNGTVVYFYPNGNCS